MQSRILVIKNILAINVAGYYLNSYINNYTKKILKNILCSIVKFSKLKNLFIKQ